MSLLTTVAFARFCSESRDGIRAYPRCGLGLQQQLQNATAAYRLTPAAPQLLRCHASCPTVTMLT